MRIAAALIAAVLLLAVPAQTDPAGFRLRASDGTIVTEQSYAGKVQLVFFGFTHCPDICPTGLSNIARALTMVGPARRDVRVLFVTVDPERDTMPVLRRYAEAFAPEVVGLTGKSDQIARIAARFGARYAVDRVGGRYNVSHSGAVYVLDREGRLARRLSSSTKSDVFAETIRILLAGKPAK